MSFEVCVQPRNSKYAGMLLYFFEKVTKNLIINFIMVKTQNVHQ